MSTSVAIGRWTEREPRQVTRCPGYYAADTETLETLPGEYELRCTFEGGYVRPMPYWILARVASVRVSGRLYSGFGGVNFASTELPAGEAVIYGVQTYVYQLGALIAERRVEVDQPWRWLIHEAGDATWHERPEFPRTWEQLRSMIQCPNCGVGGYAPEAGRCRDPRCGQSGASERVSTGTARCSQCMAVFGACDHTRRA